MTVIGLQSISLRDASFTVAEDDFTAAVNEVTFLPEAQWEHLPTFAGGFTPVWTATRWNVAVGYAQDVTAGSFMDYLLSHIGQMRDVVFTPRAGGAAWAARVQIHPGQLGGPTGEILTATAVLPVDGEPARL